MGIFTWHKNVAFSVNYVSGSLSTFFFGAYLQSGLPFTLGLPTVPEELSQYFCDQK